jgi:hypothetical protein
MSGSTRARAFIVAVTVASCAAPARAESDDFHEGRLSLNASYGFIAQFFQHDDVSSSDPEWGHGVYLQLTGERCTSVCLGLDVLGSVMIDPTETGSVGVGPHIGLSWTGPSWGGPYSFRFGAAYHWLRASLIEVNDGSVSLVGTQSAHGVGAWLSIDLELLPRSRLIVPVIGIRGAYVAVVSTEPVIHQLTGQVLLGFALGRRLDFGPEDESSEEDEEVELPLDEDEEERRLRDIENDGRELPGDRF